MKLIAPSSIVTLSAVSSRLNMGPTRAFRFAAVGCVVAAALPLGNTLRADAPIAVDDQARTVQNLPVSIPVLANDWDAESNQLAILRVTPPAHGTVTINAGAAAPNSELSALFQFAAIQLSNSVVQIGDTNRYPRGTLTDGTWRTRSVSDWISGFFPGALWYLYEQSLDTHFRTWAETWTAGIASQQYVTDTDDLGFMINNSFGNGYRLTGNTAYKPVLLQAAQSVVLVRYSPTVGCIGDTLTDGTLGVIIDSMMNLELLFRASALSGDTSLYTKAYNHAEATMLNHVRPDGSTWHGVIYDQTTGAVLSKAWRPGASADSTWARGQAWGTYGFTMAYHETGDLRFLNTAQRLADYYLANVPSDYVPYWDFQAPGIPNEPRDSSAAAITLSALLELSQVATNLQDGARYWQAARLLFNSLSSTNYLAQGSISSGVLLHGVGEMPPSGEVDVSLIYGDYYFVEALKRYKEVYSQTTVTYVPDTNFCGTDSFTYQVCDSGGDCSTATVTVVVSTAATNAFTAQISLAPPTHLPVISFPTVAGTTYDVQYRDGLSAGPWSFLATNLAGSGTVIAITDTNPPVRRFYRVCARAP